MATARELKNKIRSVNNTKKITSTMEMISTAKAVTCQRRIGTLQPYGSKLAELLRDLKQTDGGGGSFPLLRAPEKIKREVVFIFTANRGLCGGYNANVLKIAEKFVADRRSNGVQVEIHMIGKKGLARFRYLNQDVAASYTQFEDKSTYAEAEDVIAPQLERFENGEIDGISLVFTHYLTASRQRPNTAQLLPIPEQEQESGGGTSSDYIFEPSPQEILDTLLPLSLKTQFFQAVLEAATSEQIARRVAMKNATDNADEMSKQYTQLYNRNRQAGITQEILEVVGGAQSVG